MEREDEGDPVTVRIARGGWPEGFLSADGFGESERDLVISGGY